MSKLSAGLVMFRRSGDRLEVLLVHPGGPFWRNKDAGAWTIPKGEYREDEDPLAAALREFEEETGVRPTGPFIKLAPVTQRGGKTVHAWAFEGNCDPAAIRSNTFEMEWPPRSGRTQLFPEVDRAEFSSIDQALKRINPAQASFLNELSRHLAEAG